MDDIYAKCRCQFQGQLVTALRTEEFDSFQERRVPGSFLLLDVENILEHLWNIQLNKCN